VSDIFFAGHAKVLEAHYDRQAPTRWQTAYAEMCANPALAPRAGYYSYEFGHQFEPHRWATLPITSGQAMFRFLELPCWYQADHATQTAQIHSAPGTDSATLHAFAVFLREAFEQVSSPQPHTPSRHLSDDQIAALGELTAGEYTRAIDSILEDIRSGRYYEINFTQRFHKLSLVPPAQLFPRLVAALQPAYAFYAQFPDETIVSASPELFLHKHGTHIQTCPIKGSYRQPPAPAEFEKLHAEHTMVVDLARNDLGRISDAAWVSVAEQAVARRYGQITHLESRITGHTTHTSAEILAATLPAASITGNPKVITVQSIGEYERTPRGIYTGNCGIQWPNGDFQLNVAIRTLQARQAPRQAVATRCAAEPPAWQYTLGAGGAITADSSPRDEYQECLAKVRPLIEQL
jgi:para-aminobenzoate synthetase component 1